MQTEAVNFAPHLARWNLQPDGEAIHTPSSDLLPVRHGERTAMLKLAHDPEERRGNAVMAWWAGRGAAQVYAHDGAALLMERLDVRPSLLDMAAAGQDDEATRILCQAAARLPRARPWPELPPLRRWFRSLETVAPAAGGVFATALSTAHALLDAPQEVSVLHGDIHHQNLLHRPARGWLFIDPKGILGERGFDYANILCNPDLETVAAPGRLVRQAHIISKTATLELGRVLRWTLAYAGLSAAWHLEDGEDELARTTLEVARIAAGELGLPG